MASTPRSFGTWTSDAANGGTLAWVNPSYAQSSDNQRATATATGSQTTQYLKGLGPSAAVPTGATINGLEVAIEGSRSAAGVVSVQLVKAGNPVGNPAIAALGTSEGTVTVGGAADLWGTTWTEAEVNASDFGVVVWGLLSTGQVLSLDTVTVTVDHGGGTVTVDLAGTATSQGALEATKTADVDLAGAAASSGTLTAGPGCIVDLAGTSASQGSLEATKAATVALAGAAVAQGSLSVTHDAQVGLQGQAHSSGQVSWVAGALSGRRRAPAQVVS